MRKRCMNMSMKDTSSEYDEENDEEENDEEVGI